MDYEVFLLSRMKEAWDRTGDNREAVARGLERSGRIVTSAALIVVVVAGSFAFADIVLIKALGLGMAIAVALDATVVRALLVPGDDAAARPLELVAARRGSTARSAGSCRAPRPRPRRPPDEALAPVARRRASPRRRRLPAARSSPTRRPRTRSSPPAPVADRAAAPTRSPIVLPRDDGPHDRLTEWWYYTGHLAARRRPAVRLRVRRLPGRARRLPGVVGVAPRADRRDRRRASATPSGRDRAAGRPVAAGRRRRADGLRRSRSGLDPTGAAAAGRAVDDGRRRRHGPARRRRVAGRGGAATGRGVRARPRRSTARKPPALHDGDGWSTSARPAARTTTRGPRMAATGTLDARRRDARRSTGDAWFDHQWGDFISVGGGGWDWFAVNLDDGTDLTLSLVRDADGAYPLVYGTLVDARRRDAPPRPRTRSRSTATGRLDEPGDRRDLPGRLARHDPRRGARRSTLAADRRRPGARHAGDDRRRVLGGLAGRDRDPRRTPLGGEAYVELTGYAP